MQAAVLAAIAAGGGRVKIPRGEYYLGQSTHDFISPGGVSLGIYSQEWNSTFEYSTKYITQRSNRDADEMLAQEGGGGAETGASGAFFKSAQNSNTDHDPDTDDGTWWTPMPAGAPPGSTVFVIIEGEGYGSFVRGNFDGFLFDRAAHDGPPIHIVIQNLRMLNLSESGGCIRMMGVDGAEICNNDLQGHICVQAGGNGDGIILPDNTAGTSPAPTSGTSFTTTIRNNTLIGLNTIPEANSCGIIMGMHTEAVQNSIVRFQHAIRGYGTGSAIHGNRLEVNEVAIYLGMDATGEAFTAQGYSVLSNSFEANRDGIIIGSCSHSTFESLVMTDGTNGPYNPNRAHLRLQSGGHLTFSSCSFNGGDLSEGAVWAEQNMGNPVVFLNCSTSGWSWEALSAQYYHLYKFINCTGGFPGGPLGIDLTFAQLPDNSTFFPKMGEMFVAYNIEKEGGGTAAHGDYIEAAEGGGDEQRALVLWNHWTSKYQVVMLMPAS
jgi:hypothetical protein